MRQSLGKVARGLDRLERATAQRRQEYEQKEELDRARAVDEWRSRFLTSLSLDVLRRMKEMLKLDGGEPPTDPPSGFHSGVAPNERQRLWDQERRRLAGPHDPYWTGLIEDYVTRTGDAFPTSTK